MITHSPEKLSTQVIVIISTQEGAHCGEDRRWFFIVSTPIRNLCRYLCLNCGQWRSRWER